MAVGALLKVFPAGFNVDDGQASPVQLVSNRMQILNDNLLVSNANGRVIVNGWTTLHQLTAQTHDYIAQVKGIQNFKVCVSLMSAGLNQSDSSPTKGGAI